MPPLLIVSMDPMLAHIGPVAISWYGLAVAAGLLTGVWLTLREARRKGLPVDSVADMAIWVAAGGFVGARLLHVVDRWGFYSANPGLIFAVQNGGLAILGAVVGGAATCGFIAWRQRISVRRLFDAAAPGLVLGQAIGRFGCLVTGDSVGRPTDGTWGVVYVNPGAMAPKLGVAYEPVFLFEQIWDVAIFVLLWLLRRRLRADGQLFALYLGLYAAGKFGLTFLRTEVIWFLGLQEAHLVALGVLAFAIAWGLWRPRARGRLSRPVRT